VARQTELFGQLGNDAKAQQRTDLVRRLGPRTGLSAALGRDAMLGRAGIDLPLRARQDTRSRELWLGKARTALGRPQRTKTSAARFACVSGRVDRL